MTLEANADQKTPVTGAGAQDDKTTDTTSTTTDTPAKADAGASTDDGMIGSGSDDKPVIATATWPDDWRAKLAGGDEKLLKRLERFGGPDKVVQSWLAAEQKISSGDYKKALPENATDEQKAEWRKANGLPEAPDKYVLPKIDGMEWSDADKPMVDAFLTSMFGADASQAQVDAALSTYGKLVTEAQEVRVESDKAYRMEQEDKLRVELGTEFRPQINVYKRVLEDVELLPDGLGAVLANARDADGHRLINNASVAKWLIGLGLEKYGDGALISGDAKSSIASEKERLQSLMKSNYDEYLKQDGPKKYAEILQREQGRKR
jgi:hypothetical protein